MGIESDVHVRDLDPRPFVVGSVFVFFSMNPSHGDCLLKLPGRKTMPENSQNPDGGEWMGGPATCLSPCSLAPMRCLSLLQ